jgi:hypothetical protein
MSRSKRKPYFGNAACAKWWKSMFNRVIRRKKDEELPDGRFYKKMNETWTSPMEHKHGYWDKPKMRRK